jgi:hypothetical protein
MKDFDQTKTRLFSRRDLLASSACGFGWLAGKSLLASSESGAKSTLPLPHYAAKAKRVIFLFMHGGPSPMDTFDYKPILNRDSGKPCPLPKPRVVSAETGNLLGSPFSFSQKGQCGAWVSELFPHIGHIADDLCFLHGMHGSNSRHGGALLELHTGSDTFIRPSIGSWVSYGLGSECRDLPAFITLAPTLSHGGVNNQSSAFLPAVHQGVPIGSASTPADKARIPYIEGGPSREAQRAQIDLVNRLNTMHMNAAGPDSRLEAQIASMEMAFRMQATAPIVQNLNQETKATQEAYGLNDPTTQNYGKLCLMARRFIESGVRFVQVTHSYKWDQHSNLKGDLTRNCKEVDQPIAALISDLKARGLLEDTLVWWGGEFGRTPVAQGGDGRDHNPHGFTHFLAGAGVKPGFRYGATDDYGYYAVDGKVHFHDLHATILHLLGFEHTRLTYRHAGRDFRLTDIKGELVKPILA